MRVCHELSAMRFQGNRVLGIESLSVICYPVIAVLFVLPLVDSRVWGQTISSVRSFDGGVTPLFTLPGPGNLYIDNQGTQGFLYTPGNNFESFSFRNPTTGQAWSGAVNTLGPQLSIGLIQGANQSGSPLVLPSPPRQTAPLPSIQSNILDDIP